MLSVTFAPPPLTVSDAIVLHTIDIHTESSYHGAILEIRENFSFAKISRRRVFSKKRRFFAIFHYRPKKFQIAVNRTILILEGQSIAHLKSYVPNFQKHMWKMS